MTTAQVWLEALAAEIGVSAPTEQEIDDLLAFSGVAAHASERIAAPVSCYLIAKAGLTPSAAREVAARIVAALPTSEDAE
jgi:Domain of unknown function (DUF6457)